MKLETKLLADTLPVESDYDLAVYDGGGGGLRVHLHHLLHRLEIGADVFLRELDASLR